MLCDAGSDNHYYLYEFPWECIFHLVVYSLMLFDGRMCASRGGSNKVAVHSLPKLSFFVRVMESGFQHVSSTFCSLFCLPFGLSIVEAALGLNQGGSRGKAAQQNPLGLLGILVHFHSFLLHRFFYILYIYIYSLFLWHLASLLNLKPEKMSHLVGGVKLVG